MKLLIFTLQVFIALSLVIADQSKTDHERLYDHLFSNYNPEVIPVLKAKDELKLEMGVNGIDFKLDDDGVLNSRVWYSMNWTDPKLAFDPEKFGGLQSLRVNPTKLWTPDIMLYDNLNYQKKTLPARAGESSTNVVIYSTGKVIWVPPMHDQVHCKTPDNIWGKYECKLQYGSWTYDANTINLNFFNEKAEMDLEHYLSGDRIMVIENKAKREVKIYDCCPEEYVSLIYKLVLQRKSISTPQGIIKNPDMP